MTARYIAEWFFLVTVETYICHLSSCIFCNGENLLEVTNAGILRMDVISVILQAAVLK